MDNTQQSNTVSKQPPHNIICSFQEVVDIILEREEGTPHYRYDRAKCSVSIGQQLQKIDPTSVVVHIEMPNTEYNQHPSMCLVEEAKAWRTSYGKWVADKKRSERERQERFRREEKIGELIRALERIFGSELAMQEQIQHRATLIYDTRKVQVAKQLGVEI